MSNLGLELALRELGVEFLRAKVGDRNVLAMLKEQGGILGGETSGHVLCLDRTTTGDGLITALQVLAVMQRTGRRLSELAAGMEQFPQVLLNVKVREPVDPTRRPAVRDAVGQRRVGARRPRPRRAARLGHGARDPHHGRGRRPPPGQHARESARRLRPQRLRPATVALAAPVRRRRCVAARRPVSCRPAACRPRHARLA